MPHRGDQDAPAFTSSITMGWAGRVKCQTDPNLLIYLQRYPLVASQAKQLGKCEEIPQKTKERGVFHEVWKTLCLTDVLQAFWGTFGYFSCTQPAEVKSFWVFLTMANTFWLWGGRYGETELFSINISKGFDLGLCIKIKTTLVTHRHSETEAQRENLSICPQMKERKKSESLDSVTFIFQEENSAISLLCKPGLSFYICKIRINNMISFCRRTSIFLGFIRKSSECFKSLNSSKWS